MSGHTPPADDLLSALAHPDTEVRAYAATFVAVLLGHNTERFVEASEPDTSAARLEHHAADPDPKIRRARRNEPELRWRCVERPTAGNPNCPPETLRRLADDTDVHNTLKQSTEPTLTLETLACLGDDTSDQVRGAAAANLARAGNVRHPPPTNTDP